MRYMRDVYVTTLFGMRGVVPVTLSLDVTYSWVPG